MKKIKTILLFLPLFSALMTNAQNNEWVWMKGSNTPNSAGSYGIMGVPSPSNNPAARYEVAEWTDNQGRFWLYGGFDFNANNTFADLWMFNPATNNWTWMNGSNTPNIMPTYGTQGIPAPTNTPGSRKYAMATWVDQQGNLWLFGGYTLNGIGNDLWKYDMTLNQWVWMHGQSTAFPPGNYGTQTVPAPTNDPSYRCESSASWVDNNGDLWFFGGQGNGNFNDMWRFNIASNMWTWMNGSQFGFATGNWGTQGVPAATNVPSGRVAYSTWKDAAGDLWLFGGNDSSFFAGGGSRNDMWRYNIATNMWTWMSGTNLLNDPGQFGTQCVPSTSNVPPARVESRTRWVDDCGILWLFAGSINVNATAGYNDLWKFDPVTLEWTWVSGSNTWNQTAVYGTQLVPSPANHPSWRLGSVGWRNSQGLWMFGGANSNTTFMNDVWKYIPDKPTAAFTANPTSGCAPLTVQFTDQSTPNCSDINTWAWNFGDPSSGPSNVSNLQNPSHVFNAQGTYTVKLVITSCLGMKDSTQLTINANTGLNSTATSVDATCGNPNGSATVNVSNGTGPFTYAWSPSGGTGATASNLSPNTYTCTITDANGCVGTQTVTINNSSGLTITVQSQTNISCNGGNNGSATVNPSGGTGPYTYAWAPTGGNAATANNLTAGVYTVTITDATGCSSTQTVSITQPTLLSSSPSSTNATCGNNNGSAAVVASGGTGPYSYAWIPTGGTASSESNLGAGSYTCTITDANGCSATNTFLITASGGVTATLSAQQDVFCNGGSNGSATAAANGGTAPFTFAWSPVGGTNATATNLTAGNYTCTITDANNCTSTISVTITEPAALNLTTTPSSTICIGDSVVLIASATGGTGAISYVWSPGSISANTITVVPNSTTAYLVTATDANGCNTAQSITITVNQPVTLLTLGSTQICAGQTATLTANASNGGPYNWQPGNLSGANVTVSPTVTTTYTVSVFDGCIGQNVVDSVTVSVESVTADFSQTPAAGCGRLSASFTDSSLSSNNNITAWLWDFGDGGFSTSQNPTHIFNTPGSYNVTLTVTTASGCTQTYTSTVPLTVYPDPTADFTVTNLPVTTLSPLAGFQDNSLSAVTWYWNFGDGGTSTQQNPVHPFGQDTATYNVMLVVSNSYGCMDTAYLDVHVSEEFAFYIPNAFTPNGLGLNETFQGIGVGIAKYHMMIFDRWGMLFYETDDYNRPWDGTFKGKSVQEDVYVYKIEVEDIYGENHYYIGHVSVVR